MILVTGASGQLGRLVTLMSSQVQSHFRISKLNFSVETASLGWCLATMEVLFELGTSQPPL